MSSSFVIFDDGPIRVE
ncbi:Protein of unknown function, partial [Gryllus bimaculatus]